MTFAPSATADGANESCGEIDRFDKESEGDASGSNVLIAWAEAHAIEVTHIKHLTELHDRCSEPQNGLFWQSIAIAAAMDCTSYRRANEVRLMRLKVPKRRLGKSIRKAWRDAVSDLAWRRDDWAKVTGSEAAAEAAICGEVNCVINRLFGKGETMGVATGGKKAKKESATKAGRSTSLPDGIVAFDPDVTEPAAKAEFGQVIDIPLRNILVSPYQTRRPASGEWLIDLGNSLKQDGQLTPCLVRAPSVDGTYELIAGHTRLQAAKSIEWTTLRCQVIECDDATARRLVLLENAKRKDLDAIEEALALKGLVDDYTSRGLSQRQLAADIGVSQGQISNRVRLLQLPEVWQQRVISGEITATQARELAAWADVPAVMEEMDQCWADADYARPEMLANLTDAIEDAVRCVSRPIAEKKLWINGFSMRELKDTPADRMQLSFDFSKQFETSEIRRHTNRYGEEVAVTFAVEKWKKLILAVAEKERSKQGKKNAQATANAEASESQSSQLDPEAAKAKKKQLAEAYQRRLYGWFVSVLQSRVAEALRKCKAELLMPLLSWVSVLGRGSHHRDRVGDKLWGKNPAKRLTTLVECKPGDLQKEIREFLASAVSGPFDGYHPDMAPDELHSLAELLGIDLVDTWSDITADEWHAYLDLHTSDQLNALAKEWGVEGMIASEFSKSPKRSELLEWLAAGRGHKNKVARLTVCPKEIKNLKPVPLR